MIQFINIVIYMNSFNEKEKKLLDTLEKLKNFEILTIKNSKEIKLLENKKNQLEIEKTELMKKYNFMKNEYEQLKVKLDYFDKQRKEESKKEIEEHCISYAEMDRKAREKRRGQGW